MTKTLITLLLMLAPITASPDEPASKRAPAPYNLVDPDALAKLKGLFEACQTADAAYVRALSDETVIKKTYDQATVVRNQAKIDSDKAAAAFAAEWAKQHGELPAPPVPPGPGPGPGPAPNNDAVIPSGSLWLICVVPDLATVTGAPAEVQKSAKLRELLDAHKGNFRCFDSKTASKDQLAYVKIAQQQNYPEVGIIADASKAPNSLVEVFPLKGEDDTIAHVHKYLPAAGEGQRFSVVAIGANWCGSCETMKPVLKSLTCGVEHINVDNDKGRLQKFSPVEMLPCTIVLKDGVEVKRFTGIVSLDVLQGAMR